MMMTRPIIVPIKRMLLVGVSMPVVGCQHPEGALRSREWEYPWRH